MANTNIEPKKIICRIFDGENWIIHYARIDNKRRQNYIYKSKNPESAVLGYATLGSMKLGEGEL